MAYRFTADLWRHGADASWYFVTVPAEISDDIAARRPGARRGFGSVRVAARIGATAWATSVFPDTKRQAFVLPVKRAVRAAESIDAGDAVVVVLDLAEAPTTLS